MSAPQRSGQYLLTEQHAPAIPRHPLAVWPPDHDGGADEALENGRVWERLLCQGCRLGRIQNRRHRQRRGWRSRPSPASRPEGSSRDSSSSRGPRFPASGSSRKTGYRPDSGACGQVEPFVILRHVLAFLRPQDLSDGLSPRRGQTPGLPRGTSACDGGSRARPGGAIAAPGGEHGARSSSTRAAAAVATDGTQPAVPSPPGAVSARHPQASAAAQQQQRKHERAAHRQSRHRRQVRDDPGLTSGVGGLLRK